MATKVYLVSEAYLKDNTPISLNADQHSLNVAISNAQEFHIRNVLGSKLYAKLLSLVENETIGDAGNAAYKTLLDDYCRPAIAQLAYAEALPFMRYKATNKTVGGQNSENTVPLELEELKWMVQRAVDRGEAYKQRIADHCLANMTALPEYGQVDSTEDTAPSRDAYFSGMQLDDDLGDKEYEEYWKKVRTSGYLP